MNYSFDTIIERSGSDDVKHSLLQELFGRDDLLPLWVADMDFATPPFITEALRRRLEHPIFGYTVTPDALWQSIIDWIGSHHGWQVQRDWLTFIPGIVKGIGMAVNVFVRENEKVIIQPPVYHPFRITPEANGREVVFNPLKERPDGYYEMDFEQLEELATQGGCRLLILSNPHNPAGLCWDRETLRRLAAICHRHGIIVISDEIHCDMALFGHRHIPFATVSDEAAAISITFGSPSKTFNMAGIVSSYAVVPDPELRQRFYSWIEANELNHPHLFATIATIAAFTQGEEWRRQMLRYVEDNIRYVEDYCRKYLPTITPLRPQASFLVWLDCRGLGLSHHRLVDLFVNRARLALNDGDMFGPGGQGFMRLNVGTPRAILTQALERLRTALA